MRRCALACRQPSRPWPKPPHTPSVGTWPECLPASTLHAPPSALDYLPPPSPERLEEHVRLASLCHLETMTPAGSYVTQPQRSHLGHPCICPGAARTSPSPAHLRHLLTLWHLHLLFPLSFNKHILSSSCIPGDVVGSEDIAPTM